LNSTFTLGKIWGVPIGLHWSMGFVFFLLAVSLGSGVFPEEYPSLSNGTAWLLGVLTAVLFFASILLHELGHVRVAQRDGLEVKDVRLWIFGGIATIEGNPTSGKSEFRIAIAGPLISLVLAIFFFAASRLFASVDAIVGPSTWLFRTNGLLLLFNLLPGFPLDGGRIVRALVWQRTGSLQRATRVAAISGQVLAFGLMATGAMLAIRGDLISGIWIGVIGWFLQNASIAESTGVTLESRLSGVRVENAMTHDAPHVSSRLSLRLLVEQHVLKTGHRVFVVADDERPRGLISLRDVVTVPEERRDWVTVGEIMTPWRNVTYFTPDTPLLNALQLLEQASANQAPVVENDRVIGMLGREQIMRYLTIRRELGH
jgi:Zn-dependent protease/CBS domain-containing protein